MKKIIVVLFSLILLISNVSAVDDSNKSLIDGFYQLFYDVKESLNSLILKNHIFDDSFNNKELLDGSHETLDDSKLKEIDSLRYYVNKYDMQISNLMHEYNISVMSLIILSDDGKRTLTSYTFISDVGLVDSYNGKVDLVRRVRVSKLYDNLGTIRLVASNLYLINLNDSKEVKKLLDEVMSYV